MPAIHRSGAVRRRHGRKSPDGRGAHLIITGIRCPVCRGGAELSPLRRTLNRGERDADRGDGSLIGRILRSRRADEFKAKFGWR
jgi:hypothetical protein